MTQTAGAEASAVAGSAPRPAVLVHNPMAGRRRAGHLLAAIGEELTAAGWQVESRVTAAPGDATEIAVAAATAGAEALFVLGGDGTVREAAAGLMRLSRPAAGPALGVLPGGTTNVLAQALGLPRTPVAAARALGRSRSQPFDVGLCGDVPFLMMASAGLDAQTVARLSPALKARLGKPGVALQGMREWWRYRFPPVAVTVDGVELPPSVFAAVCNIRQYGGRFALAPAARWNDGRLDLVAHRGSGRIAAMGFALALARGRHLRRRDVCSHQAVEVVLDGPPGVFLQVDGDICPGEPPVTVRVGGEIRVLVPIRSASGVTGEGSDLPAKGAR